MGILSFLIGNRIYLRFFDETLKITFFDVGQGDAALIELPKGKTILVDAGGGFAHWNIGSRVLLAELSRLGIFHVDMALMTHPDQDHAFGFQGIFHDFYVGEFWLNQAFLSEPAPLLSKLLEAAKNQKITIRPFQKEETFLWQGVRLRVIPLKAVTKTRRARPRNDQSLVLFLEYKGRTALFTADIEKPAEAALKEYHLPPLSILKVAHHGSHSSSTEDFLNWAKPRWALVSVGGRNRYGHPHFDIMERLQKHGVNVFRTDLHGFVRFTIDSDGKVTCSFSDGECGGTL